MRQLSGNRVAYAGMLALAAAMGIGRFAFTPLLPMMQDDYALPVANGAWLATANYAGYLAGALVAMTTPVYPATAICGGLVAIGLATLGMGLTDDFAAWIALRAIAGIASAWVMIYVASWCLEQLAALGKSSLNGRIFAGVGLGITVAGMLSLVMMNYRWHAAAAWVTLGVFSLIVALVIGPTFVTRTDASPRTATTAPKVKMRWDSESIRLVACFATSGFGYIVPATFLPAMAKQVMHDPSIFGWSWPVFGAAALASTLAASALRRYVANRTIWIASQLVMAAGVALPAVWRDMAAIILAGLLVGGTFMVITMAAIQEARAIAGPHAISLLSALTAAFAIGQMLGPMSVSLLIYLGGSLASALLIASGGLAAGAYALSRGPRTLAIAQRRSVF
jgi:predicted MFS family arabinose efflux permease